MELMQASQQWASRPVDERYLDLNEMRRHFHDVYNNSIAFGESSRKVAFSPLDNDKSHKSLVVHTSKFEGEINPTHWAFGQLAQLAGAPAGYLRKLPAPMVADCMNYGMKFMRDVEDVGVLLHQDKEIVTMRAATGGRYGRIWNKDILDGMVKLFGDGITGDWKVPGEWGKDVPVTLQNTTLYASDQDMFVFLCDEKHRIEIPNRRDGKAGDMAKGFFIWNSEVGDCTFGISTFLFDFVCGNRIVWGAENVKEIRIRHTAGAPDRFLEQLQPALISYANSSSSNIVDAIEAAKKKRIAKDSDEVADFLAARFGKNNTAAMLKAHEIEEGRPVETMWDAATAATAFARSIPNQNNRVVVERKAGELLTLASK
jgi:hypothetical protein